MLELVIAEPLQVHVSAQFLTSLTFLATFMRTMWEPHQFLAMIRKDP